MRPLGNTPTVFREKANRENFLLHHHPPLNVLLLLFYPHPHRGKKERKKETAAEIDSSIPNVRIIRKKEEKEKLNIFRPFSQGLLRSCCFGRGRK